MNVDNWMTFGTFSEKEYFVYPARDAYAGVIINANMAAHAPAGLAAFIFEKTASIKFIIDPLTHAFQHTPSAVKAGNGDKVKASILKLSQSYGPPVSDHVGTRALNPDDFLNDSKQFKNFVSNCIEFQRSQLNADKYKKEVKKYLSPDECVLKPDAYVAPYFFMSEATLEKWLPVCSKAIEYASEMNCDKLFAEIVINQDVLLNNDNIDKIIKVYGDSAASGFLLWIDNLSEQSAGSMELKQLIRLCRGLRQNGKKEVINLHGGFFSILIAGLDNIAALSGVAHGPEFGEYRAVVPVGGGIPIARYYIPELHRRIRYREALRIIKDMGWLESAEIFHENVCNCSECRSVLSGNVDNFIEFGRGIHKLIKRGTGYARIEYRTKEAKEHCLKHYLNIKTKEYSDVSNITKDSMLSLLQSTIDKYEPIVGLDEISYLDIWLKTLT